MSTLKVDNIQSYTGGDVTLNGNLDVTGIISGDGSGLTNVPGGGSDLSSYTGSINQTGGNTTLDGDFNVSTNGGAQQIFFNGGGLAVNGSPAGLNGGINIPYDGSQKSIAVNVSGSQNYTIGGFDFGGKAYGQIYSTTNGGFSITDGAAAGLNSNLRLQSDNGSINTQAATYNINQAGNNAIWRAETSNTRLTVFGGQTGLNINPAPGSASTFGAVIDASYGFNFFNTSNYNIDAGFAYNLNSATGKGRNKIGFFSNFGAAGYADLISFQDANNYTDGAVEVHQTLNVDGSNNGPGMTLDVKDGAGISKLQVQNAFLAGLTGVDVIVNGTAIIEENLQLPGLGDYVDDAAAATGGVPVNGVYRTGNVLKIRIV